VKLKVLDLFSGIGGFSLGLERTGGFETVAFCEYEPFPRAVLAKHWPDVPCFPDVRTLKGSDIDGTVDVICGGYPCQPFSSAGKRRGKEDDRHLWPEFGRLVAELRPAWVIGENVAGHVSMGLDDVLSDLEGQGYACRPFIIPACAVDAPHRRDRTWVVANRNDCAKPTVRGQCSDVAGESGQRRSVRGRGNADAERQVTDGSARQNSENVADTENDGRAIGRARNKRCDHNQTISFGVRSKPCRSGASGCSETMADAERIRCGQVVTSKPTGQAGEGPTSQAKHSGFTAGWARWLPEPDVGRVAHGVPRRVDRLKALGNAVVPQIPEMIGRAILAAELEARNA